MKPQNFLVSVMLLSMLLAATLTACGPAAPSATPTPTETPQPTTTSPPTAIPAPTSTTTPPPTPTATTIPEPLDGFLYEWPIAPFTDEQLAEIVACQEETWPLMDEIYSGTLEKFNPSTPCEYSLFANTFIADFDTLELNTEGVSIAQQALLKNPGLILANPYFFFSFSFIDIAPPPPFTESPLKTAVIEYSWDGIGMPIEIYLDIQARDTVTATGSVEHGENPFADTEEGFAPASWEFKQEITAEAFQNLGTSLENMIPITQQAELYVCTDTSPDWIITLIYEDGTQIVLQNHESTYYHIGGPFQTKIDGQNYVLTSFTFNEALIDIFDQLELEFGFPAATTCGPASFVNNLLNEQP